MAKMALFFVQFIMGGKGVCGGVEKVAGEMSYEFCSRLSHQASRWEARGRVETRETHTHSLTHCCYS